MPPKKKSKNTSKQAANGAQVQFTHSRLRPISPFKRVQSSGVINHVLSRRDLGSFLHIVDDFLLPEECSAWITYGDSKGFEYYSQEESMEYAHRDNGRIQLCRVDIADKIYQRLAPLLPQEVDGLTPLCCSSNIRLYRYDCGQRFGKHIDESHSYVSEEGVHGVTKYTLLIYLNGLDSTICCSSLVSLSEDRHIAGGETLFYANHNRDAPVQVNVSPHQGRLLLHGHGDRCLTHEGAAVISGTKYLLRTDVVYG
mmetsp:Transcript_20062/g.28830  ORF Transcript_20062/g.28830 Transcript_20062/m.28830 type:complete len:254 (-) Transcript_20062:67-828(-)